MICKKCGNNNPDNFKFCSACGAELDQSQPPLNNEFNRTPPNGGFGQNPPPNGGFGQNPPPNGGFGQNPPPNGGFGQNPPPNGGFGQNPPPNGGFGQTPPPNGGFGQNPPPNGGFGQPQPPGMQPMPAQKRRSVLIGTAAAAVAIVILLLVLIFSIGSSQQDAADKLAKAINKRDINMMVESILPEKAIDKMETLYGQTLEDIADQYGDMDDMEGISDCKIKVKGKSDDVDEDDIDMFKKSMALMDINISDVETREIEISYKEDGEKDSDTEEAVFYKVGGNWYIIPSI